MANPVPVSYSAADTPIAGGRWAARTASVSAFVETGNVDPEQTVVFGASGSEPQISLKPYGTYHIHWLFQIINCAGKRPIFTVDDTYRARDDFHSSFRPVYSYDHGATWTRASSFTQLQTPRRTVFQFDEIFTADEVLVADQQAFTLAQSEKLANELLSDTSGMVFVSTAADFNGIIGTSPAETRSGIQVGANPIYGFRLTAQSVPHPSGRRRLLLTSGIHAGEVLDGWILRAIINFYRQGVGAKADAFRANWEILAYWNLTPNGRRAGAPRTNPSRGEDPNRDWGSSDGATAFSLSENSIVRNAILADTTSVTAHLDGHSSGGYLYETSINYYSEADQTALNAFKIKFDSNYSVPLDPKPATVVNTLAQWSIGVLGSVMSIATEPSLVRHKSVQEVSAAGVAFAETLADMVTDGAM